MSTWITPLVNALAAEGRAVLVTVAATRGSTPREAGAWMVVTASTAQATIGGGHLEFEALRMARDALRTGTAGSWLARFPLAARLGQCCGGVATVLFRCFDPEAASWLDALARRVECDAPIALATPVALGASEPTPVTADGTAVAALPGAVLAEAQALLARADASPTVVEHDGAAWFVERITAHDFRVVVFGNGHVGRALVQVLGAVPCAVTWVDEREQDFPATAPVNVTMVATDIPEAEVRTAGPASMFLVMTHRHALDFDLVAAVLAQDDFRYVGMIGSKSKRAQLERRLVARGFAAETIARVTCPVGIAGIGGRAPGVIAVAVAAQLVQVYEGAAQTATRRIGAEA
jgi:xanthine dehydrogenase accessory factor